MRATTRPGGPDPRDGRRAESPPPPSHIDDPARAGERIRAARRDARLTLRELAFPGCSPGYLSLVERGLRTPSLQVLVEIGRRLGADPEYLARGELAGKHPTGTMLDMYRRALEVARTREERVWMLTGLAQAAAAGGEVPIATSALKQALGLLSPGRSPAAVRRAASSERRSRP